MDTTMMSSRTLEIDGMTGDACVNKVTNSLRDVKGVSNAAVTVGSATMKADQAGCEAACSAIGKAGFKAHEMKSDAAGDRTVAPTKTGADAQTKSGRIGEPARADAGSRQEAEAWSNEGGKGKDKADADRSPAPAANDHPSTGKPPMPIPSPAVANAPANKPMTGNDAGQRPIPTTPGKAPATR